MKKLMIAAAIVCAAAFAQAGAVNWKIQGADDPTKTGVDLTGGCAYLFYASVDADAIEASILNKSFTADFAGSAIASALGDDAFSDGLMNMPSAVTGLSGSTELFSVYFNGATAEDSGFYVITDTVTQTLPTTAAGKPFTYNHDTWQSIPEPTSGLLLLLGVAGLALRRRRA